MRARRWATINTGLRCDEAGDSGFHPRCAQALHAGGLPTAKTIDRRPNEHPRRRIASRFNNGEPPQERSRQGEIVDRWIGTQPREGSTRASFSRRTTHGRAILRRAWIHSIKDCLFDYQRRGVWWVLEADHLHCLPSSLASARAAGCCWPMRWDWASPFRRLPLPRCDSDVMTDVLLISMITTAVTGRW